MRIFVIAVGRFGKARATGTARARPGSTDGARALYQEFASRISFPVELREVEERRPLPELQRRKREGELLLAAVPEGATVVALDQGGKALASAELAKKLARWRDAGVRDLAFAIGGADGLGAAVLARADFTLSLGPMTWPHLMVRAMLAEQLFRAECILRGHPYHRG